MMRRMIFPLLLGVSAYYALFGGEYSVFELRRIRGEASAAQVAVVDLERLVDSLRVRADLLENDPHTLEILAREDFGMIRDGELLYRFAEGAEAGSGGEDSGGR